MRQRDDGELEFLGRIDDQLSIRGHRVEPGEVSAALGEHPSVAASVTIGVDTPGADRRLVAYVVAAGSERPSRTELDAFLGRSLPAHVIPSSYVWLDELPLTSHGKIDRDALPSPVGPDDHPVLLEASNEIEAQTAAVVAELLGVDEVGVDEDFFLLGGHSMLGAQVIVRLEDLFGVEVTLRSLFDHPTVARLASEVQRLLADEGQGALAG